MQKREKKLGSFILTVDCFLTSYDMKRNRNISINKEIMYLSESAYRNKITYLSFCLAIFVVLCHTYNLEVYNISSGVLYWVETYLSGITDIAVPLFFVISGYLFFQNYTPKLLRKKWKSRLFSLIIPYCIWNSLPYFYFLFLSSIPKIKRIITNPVNGFSILDLLKEAFFGMHNGVTWFLRCLIIYTFVFPFLYLLIKKKTGALLIGVVLLGAIAIINKQIINYSIFYYFGACIGIHRKEFMHRKFMHEEVLLATAYLLVSTIISMWIGYRNQYHQITIYSVLRLSQAISIWICADVLAKEGNQKWWMTISFFIYCCHSMILESVEKVILQLFGKTVTGATIDFVFAPILTIIIIITLAWILRRAKPLWKVLTGSRGMG